MSFFKKLFIIEDIPNGKLEPSKIDKEIVEFPKDKSEVKEVKSPDLTSFTKNNLLDLEGFSLEKPETQVDISSEEIDKFLVKFIDLYNANLDKINQPGFDFYEYYNSVINLNLNDKLVYSMAFAMGKSLDKSLTTDKLLQSADFYLNDIDKNYRYIVDNGNNKIKELNTQKDTELSSLNQELTLLNQQLEDINKKIKEKQTLISNIDTKFTPLISEVENKLIANDIVRNKITNNMKTIKDGIININN
jgi:hypothetical protein